MLKGQNGSDVVRNGLGIRHVDYGETNLNTALVRVRKLPSHLFVEDGLFVIVPSLS